MKNRLRNVLRKMLRNVEWKQLSYLGQKNDNSDDYDDKYLKIKISSVNDVTLEKKFKMYDVVVHIRTVFTGFRQTWKTWKTRLFLKKVRESQGKKFCGQSQGKVRKFFLPFCNLFSLLMNNFKIIEKKYLPCCY